MKLRLSNANRMLSVRNRVLTLAFLTALVPFAHADEGSFNNSGGTATPGAITSSVGSPAGTLTISGSNFTFFSSDGSMTIVAAIAPGAVYTESCSGGGKGGHTTCSYTFTGSLSGTITTNGQSQAIIGVTNQLFPVGGSAQGTTAWNSAYTPFYYSDSEQILRSDDLQGTNQISYGTQGSGVGQFYGAYGIALDSAGRIYVADTYNDRIVRIDDMKGTNWTSFGTYGSGPGQFADPSGLAIDSAGRIYVMDAGNSRIVRMDDMTGSNWASYGTAGSGVGQFSQWLQSVAVDATGRIYVPDTGNLRLVRFDDMTGANWTALTQSAPVNGASYSFYSPVAVALDSGGRIYVADNEYYQPAVVRIDDMSGANWTYIYTGSTGGLNSISVDASDIVFAGGGGAKVVDNMAGVINSSGAIGPVGSYYVFGVTPLPLPNPRPSALGLTPASLTFSQNAGTSGDTQPVTIVNFGGSSLDLFSITTSGAFGNTSNCPGGLAPGSSCTVSVSFAPVNTGLAYGSLKISDDSGNLGSTQSITLVGTGTAPTASVSPTSLSFSSQVQGTTSPAKTVTLRNSGNGPLQVSNVAATGPFSQTNNCSGPIAPAASCAISVTFTPMAIGSATGTLTVTDNAGTQIVGLTGSGSAQVTLSSTSLSLGTVVVGTTSAAKTVTLSNHGNTALALSGIVASAGFTVASNTCGTSIAAGASCTVGVTFSPTVIGAVNGTLTFTDNAANSPQLVSLTGTGGGSVTVSPTSLDFGTVRVGSTSSAKTVTLTNLLSVSLSFSGIVTTAGFSVASNTCGSSIATGAHCNVGVTFSPTASGSATGTLTFTDSAGNGSQIVSLSGSGR